MGRRNEAARKHPKPTKRRCRHCGDWFMPTRHQGYRSGTAYCPKPKSCYYLSEQLRRHGQAHRSAQGRRFLEELDRIKRERDVLVTADVAGLLGVSPQKVTTYYVRNRALRAERVVIEGHVFYVFENADVDRFIGEWARGKDPRRLQWFDVDYVLRQWHGRGWLARLMEETGLSKADAEAVVRRRVEARRGRFVRRHAGRKPATERNARWLEIASEVIDELGGEITMNTLAGEIWFRDWQRNRDEWSGYPSARGDDDAESPDPKWRKAGVDKVRNAVGGEMEKLLQIAARKSA
jgi:hypothetical protein